jgi:hypothetical protein
VADTSTLQNDFGASGDTNYELLLNVFFLFLHIKSDHFPCIFIKQKTMNELVELTHLATQLNSGKFSVFTSLGEGKKYYQLFQGLKKGTIKTDDDGLKKLYGGKKHLKTFHKLKERYKNRILASLLHHDLARYFNNQYSKSIYRVMCNILACEVAIMKGKGSSINKILAKNYQSAEYFQLTHFQILQLQTLLNRSAYQGDSTNFRKYQKKLNEFFPKFSAEVLSNNLSTEMTLEFAKSISPTHKMEMFSRSLQIMKDLALTHQTYFLWLNYYRASIRTNHLRKKNKMVMSVCDDAINYLESIPHIAHKERIGEFLLHKMENAILAGDYTVAELTYEKAKICITEDNPNQLVLLSYYFLLNMHIKNYKKSNEILLSLFANRNYKRAPSYMKERWILYKAYLFFADNELFSTKSSYISRSLNKLKVNIKDNSGFNISIYFMNILLQMLSGDLDSIELKKYSFYSYFNRHIKKETNPRAYYFSRLLKTIIKYHNDLSLVRAKGRAYISLLKKSKHTVEFPEVIPYESLWQLVLEKVKVKSKIS